MLTVPQLRIIVNKIVVSPQRRQHFKRCARKYYHNNLTPKGVKLETLMVVRDVVTRWNYMHAMIKRALVLQKESLYYSESISLLLISCTTDHRQMGLSAWRITSTAADQWAVGLVGAALLNSQGICIIHLQVQVNCLQSMD